MCRPTPQLLARSAPQRDPGARTDPRHRDEESKWVLPVCSGMHRLAEACKRAAAETRRRWAGVSNLRLTGLRAIRISTESAVTNVVVSRELRARVQVERTRERHRGNQESKEDAH
jgi:hypothetical protein